MHVYGRLWSLCTWLCVFIEKALHLLLIVPFRWALTSCYLCNKLYWSHAETRKSMPGDSLLAMGALQQANFFGREKSSEYGGIYRVWDLGYPVVVIADPTIAKQFYTNHIKHERTPAFSSLGYLCTSLLGHAIGVAYGDDWTRHRVSFKHDFVSTAGISDRLELIHKECKVWVDQWHGRSSLPINSSINRLTLDILSKVVYGSEAAGLCKERIHAVADLHEELLQHFGGTSSRLPLYSVLPSHTNRMLREFQEQWKRLNNEIAAEPGSVLQHLRDESELSEGEILANLDEILLFNIDVMYSAIGAVFVNLAKHPAVQEQVYKEIAGVVGESEEVVVEDLEKLPLLEAFVQESARMCPSLALSFPEQTPHDMTLGGYGVPKGTVVLVDAFSINYHPQHWSEADEFDISRHLAGGATKQFQPALHRFGLGPRRCLGQRYAQKILMSLSAQMMWRHQIAPQAMASGDSSVESAVNVGPAVNVGVKRGGLPFFTPYSVFPDLQLQSREGSLVTASSSSPIDATSFSPRTIDTASAGPLPLAHLLHPVMFNKSRDVIFEHGIKELANRGAVLCGISLGNSYYTDPANLKNIFHFFAHQVSRFYPFTPSTPSIHTFRAKGCSRPEKKMVADFKRLKQATEQAYAGTEEGICQYQPLLWDAHIEPSPIYQESLVFIRNLYDENMIFKTDINSTSLPVLKSYLKEKGLEDNYMGPLMEAKEFLLKELAFLRVSPQILQEKSLAYVYHQPWPILNDLLLGEKFSIAPTKNVGFIVLGPCKD